MTRFRWKDSVSTMPWLDKAATALKKAFDPIAGESAPQVLKDALVGTWLGHPLHPVLVQLPIGFWSSAPVLDLLGHDDAADAMIAAGLVASAGAAASGAAQWLDATEEETPRRLGALHAVVNTAGIGCYGASYLARRNGHRRQGVAWSLAGMGFLTVGGLIGGDLAYDLGIGVNHAAFDPAIEKWSDAAPVDDLTEQKPLRVEVGGAPVLLVRDDDGVHALGAVCPHLGAPMEEGTIQDGEIVCPWHGSTFCLTDGDLKHGPATSPLPSYQTRVRAGQIQVRSKPA